MTRRNFEGRFGRSARRAFGVFGVFGMLMGVATAGAALAGPADQAGAADGASRPAVAAAGPCAEPREARAGVGDPDFDVAGPATALFDPIDVAAGPAVDPLALRPAPPTARGIPRPGACDQPGSGCGAAVPSRSVVVVPPVDPGTRPPRGAN